ncbi:MAG: hypothetical protein Q9214_002025 [Letrouitia sp. 1 TL-2023]
MMIALLKAFCNKPSPSSIDDCNHAEDCNRSGHESCWDSHIPRKGKQKHEKIDAFSDYLANLILHSEADNEVQTKLHEKDRKAEWFTVNSGSLEDSEPTVQITDRFRKLCDARYVNNMSNSEQCPSIVSFIGTTGAGKSTLVNAVSVMGQIELQSSSENPRSRSSTIESMLRPSNLPKVEQTRRNGPVTRSGNPLRAAEPTSTGVHLYLDPGVTKVSYLADQERELVPMLYADCEGFRGTNETNAERSVYSQSTRLSRRLSLSSQGGPPSRMNSNAKRNICDELEITLPEIKDAGKAGEELYYARFLYAFSDVIVFVTNNDQQLHKDLQDLLEWAASAVHKTINHLPRKTLIVVQNMPARHNPDYYSESFHKQSLFGSLTKLWEKSRVLSAFKKRHDKQSIVREGEIHTNEQFLNIFFQSVEVCYVPNKGFATSAAVMRQYRVLRKQIVQAVEAGQRARSNSWTRYDVSSLSHLFGRAFHHFAKLPGPFDFYTAARKDNPMSVTMADHIANLLRHMQAFDRQLDNFHSVVAVCLITFVYRDFRQAIEPKEVFDRTLRRVCAKAIQTYQNKYQQCAFWFPDGQRCKVIRLTHSEHCNSDERGSKIPGNFDSADYSEAPGDTLRKIEHSFIDMFKTLCSRTVGGSVHRLPPLPDLAEFRRHVLASTSLQDSGFWEIAKSNKTCFACLQSVPDHALPCGHVFCEQCVKDFGQSSEDQRSCIEMTQCVLCLSEWFTPPQLIQLKPKFAGVRVLTLDGGGIRGIVELAILGEIERRVGLNVPIRDMFDLIVGTSTGGIIALGLTMTEYSLSDMTRNFFELSKRTFKENRGGILSAFDPLNVFPAFFIAVKAWDSKYRTKPLREGLISQLSGDMSMFPASTFTGSQRKVRVAVTSTTSGEPCIFTNYNRMVSTDSKDFEREDEQSKEAKVWEAALATSAAPIYFKSFERGRPPKVYSDGALKANLPVELAVSEIQKIWPPSSAGLVSDRIKKPSTSDRNLADSIESLSIEEEEESDECDLGESSIESSTYCGDVHLDTLVSIGTGEQKRTDIYPSAFEVGGLKEAYLSFIKAMDTEAAWNEFKGKSTYDSRRYYRLNIPIIGKYVSPDDWSQMQRLEESVRKCYTTSTERLNALQDVASRLTASLLFFEPDAPRLARLQPPDSFRRVHGQIWCRLARDTSPLRALIDRISGFWIREDNPRIRASPYVPVTLKDDWKSEIRTKGKHLALPITLKTTEPESTITLAVSLRDVSIPGDPLSETTKSRMFPISGFPVVFKDVEAKMKAE